MVTSCKMNFLLTKFIRLKTIGKLEKKTIGNVDESFIESEILNETIYPLIRDIKN